MTEGGGPRPCPFFGLLFFFLFFLMGEGVWWGSPTFPPTLPLGGQHYHKTSVWNLCFFFLVFARLLGIGIVAFRRTFCFINYAA